MHDNRAVRVHLDPKNSCSLGLPCLLEGASALRPSGPPPVTHLGSMYIHTTSWMFRYSIVDVPVQLFPKPPSVSGTWDDLRSHIVFQHFRVRANIAQSKRKR